MGEIIPEHHCDQLKAETDDDPEDTSVANSINYLQVPEEPIKRTISLTQLDTINRETWGKKIDFLLSVIGFAVDLGNVWRFPYLCFKNGGGVFFIPYFMMILLAGLPLFFMELALGQYYRQGAITCWGRVCPLFKGIGYCVILIAFYTDFYYNVIISWAIYFFVASFNSVLPWSTCNNSWNTEDCYEPLELYNLNTNGSDTCAPLLNDTVNYTAVSSSQEYFERGVLNIHGDGGILNPGELNWRLVLCLAAVYLICYFSLWKGIKMSGKVVWFTAVFPYIVLFCLLIRGITLPGASRGIQFYLQPNFAMLADGNVWFDAATQVFFSLGPGFGVLLAFASYNKFNNNIYLDALITAGINSGTSFLAGFVIFSVLGYMSCKSGLPVKDVATDGPGLVFIVYPEALATMPGSTFWSLLFFLMLITLGLDSSFGGSEAIVTALSDEFSWIRRHREIFIALLFIFYFLVGLLMCTEVGIFFVDFLTAYTASFGLLMAVLCETVVISWIYGLRRFLGDIREMIGFTPGPYWQICWAVIGPIFLMFNLVYGCTVWQPAKSGEVDLPWWMNIIGWIMALSSAAFIPIIAIHTLIKAPGNTFCQKLRASVTPWKETVSAEKFYEGIDTNGSEAQPLTGIYTGLSTPDGHSKSQL